ncbi:MAG: DivIVA domain-containing protein [Candidatus Heteroscillospira sp.]|jgi:cell division initiation protein
MMTPQDIREKTFEKAVFGGYDMAAVDECLEEICEDYSALQKENATLKAKLKVLASKIEEYRESEDAMRMTLLSAQKMSVQIEAEAKTKSERMVAEAEAKSAKLSRDAQLEVANEEARLVEAKRASAQFLENMRLLCQKQLDFLDHLGEMKIVDDLPRTNGADADTIKAIQSNVARAAEAPSADMDLSRELDSIGTPAAAADSPTRPFTPVTGKGFNFDDLKYGEKK